MKDSGDTKSGQATVLIANPSLDVYGSDLQMLESIRAFASVGARVVVVAPAHGPLGPQVVQAGAELLNLEFPVLRRTDQSLAGLARLAAGAIRSLPHMVRLLRIEQASALYVNTVTIPWWLVAGRLARVRTICHVHEAEGHDTVKVRQGLYLPLVLAHTLIMISRSAHRSTIETVRRLEKKSQIIPNGVPDRDGVASLPQMHQPLRLGVVARISPRKGTADALRTAETLRRRGFDVELHLFGSTFSGYEWYEAELRALAETELLRGLVTFHGYVRPIWKALDDMDVLLAPSHIEPFGNAVVEAQLSLRPVVASRAEGHTESIEHGVTGLLVDIGDHESMADEVQWLVANPRRTAEMAVRAREAALTRNGVQRYRDAVVRAVLWSSHDRPI